MNRCASRPAIGVLCCNEVMDRPIQTVASRFVRPLSRISDALVLLIPAMVDACDADGLVARLDGLLFTGPRSNVAPERFGGLVRQTPLDEERDAVAFELAARMIDADRPVFGICRGLQELNVLFGGTLSAHGNDAHHHADDTTYQDLFAQRHAVTLAEGGQLATATGKRRLVVNSVCHQAIDRLGYGLDAEAHADDGLIEAVGARPGKADVLGVQWHPECDVDEAPASRAFFTLIDASLRGQTH